tara:strand:- start:349 stop:873 length:525 start_codon:yes stop_codon:yes gene_type:complete
MAKKSILKHTNESILYNNILSLSRNKLFYTKFALADSFQNRINLIFMHLSLIFIKTNQKTNTNDYKDFYQKVFDLTFNRIELNMREIGYGDVYVNKNMKFLVKTFYNILLYFKKYSENTKESKNNFFNQYLKVNNAEKDHNNEDLIKYFDNFYSFCFDLSEENVLKGELKFNYI